jgi:putative transcriptional regulator
MGRGLIRWKLNEVMARHRVKGKDLADYLGISPNSVSLLKKATVFPEIGGERWEQICAGINELSQIDELITPFDMVEYVENQSSNVSSTNISSKISSNGGNSTEKSPRKRKTSAA